MARLAFDFMKKASVRVPDCLPHLLGEESVLRIANRNPKLASDGTAADFRYLESLAIIAFQAHTLRPEVYVSAWSRKGHLSWL